MLYHPDGSIDLFGREFNRHPASFGEPFSFEVVAYPKRHTSAQQSIRIERVLSRGLTTLEVYAPAIHTARSA